MKRYQIYSMQLIISLLTFTGSLYGQYWQQYVEYDMAVVLDTGEKTLTARSELIYVNHSPDTLHHVLMHLYDNAFNEGTIAQQVQGGRNDTYIKAKSWTGIRIKAAVADSLPLTFVIRDDTILDITLNRSLFPGDTLHFRLDWTSLIHPHLGRSGYEEQQFDFAQWYPKFVVYDENGWHDDPFGGWGEFYGEFGNFTVSLDVPAGQIVGATGVVNSGDPGWTAVSVDTSRAWDEWVKEFSEDREAYLINLDSTSRRKVTFVAENVHDFAWLCSPDFVYEHGQWNGIDVNVLFTTRVGEKWTRAVVKHGISALSWLSKKFGPYPWPQMTISKALLGGGMEYPMLIMDASESESLIVHEIGHNWFYGLFGNDELDDAWLDEGFTTFQTRWYQEHYYPQNGYAITRDNITSFEAEHLPRQMYLESALKPVIAYLTSPRNEPIATHSFDFINQGSYRTNVYSKASLMLHSLKEYLGEDRFLAGMGLYYRRWALKHVNEERFIKAMEDGSGEELDWFFDQWLHTTHFVDYRLLDWQVEKVSENHYQTRVTVENSGGLFVPIPVTLYGSADQLAEASLQDFRYRQEGVIEIESDFEPVRVKLDADNVFLDVDRRNNDSRHKPYWRYNFKGWHEYPDDSNLYLWKPLLGYTDVAGLGLGLRIDRVYRNPGAFIALEVDQNSLSGNMDATISFKRTQPGLPFQATPSGSLGFWRSFTHASLGYAMKWAEVYWEKPIHFLTLEADFSDATYAAVAVSDQTSFTRLGVHYQLQQRLWGGSLGLSARLWYSPEALGSLNKGFDQQSLMARWAGEVAHIKIVNRSNFTGNSSQTPDLVKSRVASQDLRSIYLDRAGSSLYNTNGIDFIGAHYYLAGGGRMRAYTDSLDLPVNYLWSNNLDLSVAPGLLRSKGLSISAFLDLGQRSVNADNWTWLGDVGVGLQYKPRWRRLNWLTTFVRPVTLRFELPLARIENDAWEPAISRNIWNFSISN